MFNKEFLIQKKNNGYGKITVSYEVIKHIVDITFKDFNKIISFKNRFGNKAIKVFKKNNALFIEIKVFIYYGQNVEIVCKKIQKKIKKNIDLMLDFKNSVVNIKIVGFKF